MLPQHDKSRDAMRSISLNAPLKKKRFNEMIINRVMADCQTFYSLGDFTQFINKYISIKQQEALSGVENKLYISNN